MRRERNPGGPLEDRRIPVQVRLAAWWATLVFLYVYVDILGLYMPGVLEDILAGVVWELEIDQTWAFVALMLMAVPILMVALSITLPARANRRANLVVAPLYVVVSVANGVGESWTYYFAMAICLEVLVLTMIVRGAWTWPRAHRRTARAVRGRPDAARLTTGGWTADRARWRRVRRLPRDLRGRSGAQRRDGRRPVAA